MKDQLQAQEAWALACLEALDHASLSSPFSFFLFLEEIASCQALGQTSFPAQERMLVEEKIRLACFSIPPEKYHSLPCESLFAKLL